jgi:hypothetical protein
MTGMKLSEPQERLVQKMKSGAKLQHHLDSGLFRPHETSTTRTVHPATVESLLKVGLIRKTLGGECFLH